MVHLHLNCSSGMAGNMMIGLCIDLGVSYEELREFLLSTLEEPFSLHYQKENKNGIQSSYFNVLLENESLENRFLPQIIEVIDSCKCSNQVKEKAKQVFWRLAKAEALVHGIVPEEVHFHEVGAVDAIIDILGSCWCLDKLGITQVTADSLYTGRGWVQCAHGIMPVPAPATEQLLIDIPYQQGDISKELLTPTGAALLAEWVDEWGERPRGFITQKIGYGAGTMDLVIPNVVQGALGILKRNSGNNIWMIETHVDDCNPQFIPELQQNLLKMGCADAWVTAIQMKKGRLGTLLSVLAKHDLKDEVEQLIFSQIPTLGIRSWEVERTMLERTFTKIKVLGEEIQIKQGWLDGKIVNQMPEWEDCLKAAHTLGVAPRYIWLLALQSIDSRA